MITLGQLTLAVVLRSGGPGSGVLTATQIEALFATIGVLTLVYHLALIRGKRDPLLHIAYAIGNVFVQVLISWLTLLDLGILEWF
jgi:hypothetical protein